MYRATIETIPSVEYFAKFVKREYQYFWLILVLQTEWTLVHGNYEGASMF